MRGLFDIFITFFRIGIFTFGGGYAMIPLIEREVIDKKRWIEHQEFLELLTLAQSAPGPISLNTSVFVGYKLRGYAGAAAAISGVVIPSFSIILLIAIFFSDIRHNPTVDAAFKGMRPVVVALIIAPIVSLSRGIKPWGIVVAAAVAVAVWHFGVSPILLIACGAAAGLSWTLWKNRKKLKG